MAQPLWTQVRPGLKVSGALPSGWMRVVAGISHHVFRGRRGWAFGRHLSVCGGAGPAPFTVNSNPYAAARRRISLSKASIRPFNAHTARPLFFAGIAFIAARRVASAFIRSSTSAIRSVWY